MEKMKTARVSDLYKDNTSVITQPSQYKRQIMLVEIDNPMRQYPCEMNGEITIGRSRSSDICIPYDIGIGRHHCSLYFAKDVLLAHDLGSVNHTVVNGFMLTQKDNDIPVRDGDILLLGDTRLKLSIT